MGFVLLPDMWSTYLSVFMVPTSGANSTSPLYMSGPEHKLANS